MERDKAESMFMGLRETGRVSGPLRSERSSSVKAGEAGRESSAHSVEDKNEALQSGYFTRRP